MGYMRIMKEVVNRRNGVARVETRASLSQATPHGHEPLERLSSDFLEGKLCQLGAGSSVAHTALRASRSATIRLLYGLHVCACMNQGQRGKEPRKGKKKYKKENRNNLWGLAGNKLRVSIRTSNTVCIGLVERNMS